MTDSFRTKREDYMTMLIPEAISHKSFSYCVMIGYCGWFGQTNMVAMSKVDGKSTMNARGTVTRQIFKY
jgi:hypothetical protein